MPSSVLQVCPYLHPSAGGPVFVVMQYARRLPELGFASPILTTNWYSPGGRVEVERRCGAEYDLTVLDSSNNFLLTELPASRRRIRAAVEKADLLHVHGLWHALGRRALREARALGRPWVISTHGMLDPYSMSVSAAGKRIYWRCAERRNVLEADRVLFTTQDEFDLAEKAVGSIGRGTVVLLGADDPPAADRTALKAEALKRFPFLADRRVVLYLGRLHEKKGLHLALPIFRKVLSSVPDAALLVVGDGEASYLARIQSEIARLGLQGSVHLVGLLEGRDKWAAIAASDLFILPSQQENFALVVAEVLKMGVPVVISEHVNLAPHILSADAGRVLPLGDLAAWVKTISELLQDDSERQRLRQNGLELANEKFTWDRSTRELAGVYESVLCRTT